jgi:hypothetical protein
VVKLLLKKEQFDSIKEHSMMTGKSQEQKIRKEMAVEEDKNGIK